MSTNDNGSAAGAVSASTHSRPAWIRGVVPVVLTPLEANGDIDTEGCGRLVEFLIDNGVAGLYVLGSAGENTLLDVEQRITVARAMARANAGRVPLIVGCSNTAPRNVFRFMEAVGTEPITAFHYIPYDLKVGDERLVAMITEYADRSPLPLYLYHNTKRARPFTPGVVSQLKAHPAIHGMKVGGYLLSEMQAFLALEDESFQVLGSGGGQFLPWLMLGASAVTASSACCFPREFKQMYDCWVAGDLEGARRRQRWWKAFHARIPNTNGENGEFSAEEKYVLQCRGVIKEHCHFPFRPLRPEEKARIERALEEEGLT